METAQLEAAIRAQEALRPTLGDAVVNAAIAAIRAQLTRLHAEQRTGVRAGSLADLQSDRDAGRQDFATVTTAAPPAPSSRSLDGERKYVTVLFADVSGFTAMSERLDAEDVRAFQNDMFPELARIVQRYEGFVEKFVGDAILAAFGAPIAHEDDPERALRAALEMRARMRQLSKTWAPRVGRPLTLHIGVNTGTVIAGEIGGADARSGAYAVTGDTTNTAARLLGTATGEQIVVGLETYRRTAHAFEFRVLEPMRLKGKVELVQAYELLGPRRERTAGRGLDDRGLDSPLVGRQGELTALHDAIDGVRDGQGGVVFVLGDAGLGKSRLVAEARRHATGVTWLEGRCLSYTQSISYWPFLEFFRRDASITEGDTEDQAWDKLSRRVTDLFPEDPSAVLPYLATMLSVEPRGEVAERVRYLDADAVRRQIFSVVRRYVRRLSRNQPLVLVFEDIHWADDSSVALMEHLVPLVAGEALTLCFVSRPEGSAAVEHLAALSEREQREHTTRVTIHPLNAEHSADLVRHLLRATDLPSTLRALVLDRSEGNPFFVEEVIRTLIDLGGLTCDHTTGRWFPTERVAQITIPDTLQGILLARIDRLDDELKQALRLASVIGRVFFFRVLQAISDAERRLEDRVSKLEQLELIRERSRIPELEYIFKHVLVQEAAYDGILVRRRKELHRHVAECIDSLFAERLDEFTGVLAYHYSRAEEWEKAQAYMFRAGDQAGSIAADAEALTYYREALAAHERAFSGGMDPFQRGVLERKLGEALFRRGELPEADIYFQRALACFGAIYPKGKRAVRASIVKQLARQIAHRRLGRLILRPPRGRARPHRC